MKCSLTCEPNMTEYQWIIKGNVILKLIQITHVTHYTGAYMCNVHALSPFWTKLRHSHSPYLNTPGYFLIPNGGTLKGPTQSLILRYGTAWSGECLSNLGPMTTEHMLYTRSEDATLWIRAWPTPTGRWDQLFGSLADLQAMAAFIRESGSGHLEEANEEEDSF